MSHKNPPPKKASIAAAVDQALAPPASMAASAAEAPLCSDALNHLEQVIRDFASTMPSSVGPAFYSVAHRALVETNNELIALRTKAAEPPAPASA